MSRRGWSLSLLLLAFWSSVGPDGVAAQVPTQAPAAAPAGLLVDSIAVRGNQRLAEANIVAYSAIQPGQTISEVDLQGAIVRLMGTRNFDDVQLSTMDRPAGGVILLIEVVERPLIVGYDFEGLERISAGDVRDTVGLISNSPLNPQQIVRAGEMIRELLGKAGVQLASLDTVMVPVPERTNAYRLVFRVEEGNRLAIADIDFVGNDAFDDEALRGTISTKTEGFFWFRQGRYDRDKLRTDLQQTLPAFYGSRGYIDFAVVSDSLVIDPVTGKARLLIEVDEGPQYRLGDFAVEGARRFPVEQIERMFTEQSRPVLGILPFGGRDNQEQGAVFDQAALSSATTSIQQLYRNEGYLFAEVQPIVQRVTGADGEPRVDVTLRVNEQSPFYVRLVSIEGNTFTHESVIRDRLVLYPGDVYSEDRLIQSYRAISALGFFESPLPYPVPVPNPEEGTVDIVFKVQEKQTGSINFGTSVGGAGAGGTGGLSGFLGYSQPNLFGQAKQASVQAEYGYGRSSFTASYTDPAILGSRNSASVSLYHTDDRYRGFSFSEGRYVRTGASLRYGFPVLNYRWTRAFAGYSLSQYSYEAREADDCEPGNIFCQPSALASTLSLAVTRDTKDHPMFPTLGSMQNVAIQQTGGLLGGDGNFQKLNAEAEWWVPVGTIGGGTPGSRGIVTSFGFRTRLGGVFGDASRFPLERFFLGGTQFGQSLRGYEESTVTPFGYFDRDDPGITSNGRLGDAFFVITGEYALRLSDAISVSAFGEAGNIWNTTSTIYPGRLFRSLGVGATVVTPFGPLGLDVAYGFDRVPAGWKLHFKINQPGS